MANKKNETAETVENMSAPVHETEKTEKKADAWIVSVENNPKFCGKGAGGAQFANGQARIMNARLAAWFEEHPGYTVNKE